MTPLEQILVIPERAPRKQRFGKAVKGGPSERDIQRPMVTALRKLGFMVHHSPNASMLAGDKFARVKQAAAVKADGMLAGFPDLVLIDRDGEVGFLEVKKPGEALTDSQAALLPKLRARSPRVAVVVSLDDALEVVRRWGWINA